MILVTGGNGFIGKAILAAYGDATVSLTRRPDGTIGQAAGQTKRAQVQSHITFDLTRSDLAQELARQLEPLRITEIIHTAAVTPWSKDPDFSLDAHMAKTVTQVCNLLHIPRLTFLSGWIVYDMHGDGPFDESTPLGPTIPYGKSKLASERYFATHLRGTKAVNLRLASLYGPGQTSPGLIPNFVKTALAGEPLTVGAVKARRDYLYIDDLLDSLKRLSEVDIVQHMDLNLGSGQAVTVEDVAKTIQEICGELDLKPVQVKYQEQMKEAVPLTNGLDIAKAQSLGLLRRTTDLHDGLLAYITWRKDQDER